MLADLHLALVEAVKESDTLLLLNRSPPDEADAPSITVGQEKGEEEFRLSLTLEPDSEQVVFRGVYWRTGEFVPDRRERHGLLFSPAVLRLDDDGYWLGDPRPGSSRDEGDEVELYGAAGEAAGFLLELVEHFYGVVEERSD